jgi:hypothetical protein
VRATIRLSRGKTETSRDDDDDGGDDDDGDDDGDGDDDSTTRLSV